MTQERQDGWRVGGKVPLNVYEGDTPMFQCHTPEQAARIVKALNAAPAYFAVVEAAKAFICPQCNNSGEIKYDNYDDGGTGVTTTPCTWCVALREALAGIGEG